MILEFQSISHDTRDKTVEDILETTFYDVRLLEEIVQSS